MPQSYYIIINKKSKSVKIDAFWLFIYYYTVTLGHQITGYLTSNWNFYMGYCEDMVNATTLGS